MTAYPPVDLRSFLELSAGKWLALRSLMDSESGASLEDWHASERGELEINARETAGLPELEITLPDQSKRKLSFQSDGNVWINSRQGQWQLHHDGTLELEVQQDTMRVKERIWFSKPNLRLRCTLEQFLDGRPGRASFSTEIRRVTRPPEEKPAQPQ